VEDGKIEVHVSKTYSLEEATKALNQIQTLHTKGKTVIKL
ncbi:MAG: zinc-binding dehydrogenase, partial [Candidatus Korarchaeota archaeon]|nr:zinc-binding dehydrogenase [Candidatus Korarchaeota archaeon]